MVNDKVTLNDCSDYYFVTSSNDTANSTWSSGSSVYVIELASSDTIIQTIGTTPPFIQTVFSAQCNLIINEIHYDNMGTNTLEGVDTVTLSTKDCTSLEEANDIQKLKIFPNPNNGTFNLSLDNFSQEKGSFEIVNIN